MKVSLKDLLLLLASVIFSALVIEGMLRLTGVAFPVFGIMDQYRGYAGAPGAEGWFTAEGRAYVVINSDGLRDREHSLAKPPGTLRIAVLGDSYAQALQLDIPQTFWGVVERELNACPAVAPRVVEVINFGVDGYGTSQELLTLRHQVWKYDPDVVLLAMFSGNDLGDNTREIRRNTTVPYFLLQDDQLVLDNSFRDRTFDLKLAFGYDKAINWLNRLRLVQVIKEAQRVLPAMLNSAPAGGREGASAPEIFNDGLEHEVYAPPKDEIWKKAWDVTEALIAETAKEAHDGKADFWLVLLTNGIQVHPDLEVRKAFERNLGVEDLRYPNRRIGALASRLDVPFVDLAGPLADYAETKKVYLHGFPGSEGRGHWNAEGHRLAGQEIAKAMCQAFSDRR